MKNEIKNGDHCEGRKAYHSEELKLAMVQRLNRIEGQVRGIARMIDQDHYCDDVLHQILAVESALAGVKKTLLEAHLKGCVVDQIVEGKKDVVDELLVTMGKMMR